MRALMQVTAVKVHEFKGVKTGETVHFAAVGNNAECFDEEHDACNTFARWEPSADARFMVQNPSMFGQFKIGGTFQFVVIPVLASAAPLIGE